MQNTIFQTKSNNQRKKADKEIKRLKGMYRDIEKDSKQYDTFTQMKQELQTLKDEVDSMVIFQIQSDKIISLLIQDNFIQSNDEDNIKTYSLTEQGSIASNIESHPIIEVIGALELLSSLRQYNSRVVSCFTDIKLPSDERYLIPSSEDDSSMKKYVN